LRASGRKGNIPCNEDPEHKVKKILESVVPKQKVTFRVMWILKKLNKVNILESLVPEQKVTFLPVWIRKKRSVFDSVNQGVP
jgi:hypothetical protein